MASFTSLGVIISVSQGCVHVGFIEWFDSTKLEKNNSMYYAFFCEGDKSPWLKEDISRGCVYHQCIEWFNSPCTEGIIFKVCIP